MENKEMYTKQEVVEMLKDMQRETGECVGFFCRASISVMGH